MTEQELRALVRSVIAQHVGSPQHPDSVAPASSPLLPAPSPLLPAPSLMRQHASHALFVIPAQGDACIIEPGVTCNHCGYCKSYGH
jgi:hypothetical protein